MGKVIKVYSYRGINVYIRHLFGMWYEAMWVWGDAVCVHDLHLLRSKRSERRNNQEERDKGAIAELQFIVMAKLDALINSRSIQTRIKDEIKYLWQKAKEWVSKPQRA